MLQGTTGSVSTRDLALLVLRTRFPARTGGSQPVAVRASQPHIFMDGGLGSAVHPHRGGFTQGAQPLPAPNRPTFSTLQYPQNQSGDMNEEAAAVRNSPEPENMPYLRETPAGTSLIVGS
jgi:hypothetical protein